MVTGRSPVAVGVLGGRHPTARKASVLSLGDRQQIEESCQHILQQRLAKQPLQSASAGSFFKNPVNHVAGRLIEQAGLKGLQHGGAMISSKHANFIINTGGATATEIYELMQIVQERVYSLTRIMLEPEVRLLGDWHYKEGGE